MLERSPLACRLQDLLIYDEEGDQLKHISFSQALLATGASAAGSLVLESLVGNRTEFSNNLPNGPLMGRDGKPASTDVNDLLAKLKENKQDPRLTVPLTPALLIEAVAAGIWIPVCITIVRPFIEHLMMSTIATVSGRDTGATLFGPADMQISANTSVKTIEGARALRSRALSLAPRLAPTASRQALRPC